MLHRDAGTCPSQLLPSPSVFQPAPGPPAILDHCLHPAHCQGFQILSAKTRHKCSFPWLLAPTLGGCSPADAADALHGAVSKQSV